MFSIPRCKLKVIHINHQPISKRDHDPDGRLVVHSVFHTIQGEGPFTGVPAVFVRLQGCNLQCPGCDTEYSSLTRGGHWDVNRTLAAVAKECGFPENQTKLVVITGGEPFRQNLLPLVRKLCEVGFQVQIETNGTLPPPEGFQANKSVRLGTRTPIRTQAANTYVIVSPKAGKVHPKTAELACAFKYVLQKDSIDELDMLPTLALGHTASPRVARPPVGFQGGIYVQPMDQQDEALNAANIQACVTSAMTHGYILQLQTHKYINVE